MPITKQSARQQIIDANVDVAFGDIPTTATAYSAIDVPVNSIITGGDLVVTTAWNTGTTATLSVGDASSAARYLGATDIKTAARTALVPTGFLCTSTEPAVTVTTAFVGTAATAGGFRLRLSYIVKGRAQFTTGLGR